MRNNEFAWIRYGKYLGGLLFIVPQLRPLLFCLFFYFILKIKFKFEIKINRVYNILFLILLFIPVIILINALSFYLLNDFSQQKIVTSIIEKDHISYSQVFSILVFSPVIEELYFRKVLLEELSKRIGSLWSIFSTSLYFSIIHLNILSFPTLLALGILLGTIFQITKSVTLCIIVHVLFNFFMLCAIIMQ
jgi:membrane protease YdiL (CAAX protease family)